MKKYTVWVGGGEVNDNYLTKTEAEDVAEYYADEGYTDITIEEVEG